LVIVHVVAAGGTGTEPPVAVAPVHDQAEAV
jgi:hypothetical protein